MACKVKLISGWVPNAERFGNYCFRILKTIDCLGGRHFAGIVHVHSDLVVTCKTSS